MNIVGNGQLRPKCMRCLNCGYSSEWEEDDYYVAIGTISLPRKPCSLAVVEEMSPNLNSGETL